MDIKLSTGSLKITTRYAEGRRSYYWNFDSDQRDIDANIYRTSAVTLVYVQRA
jgi:hypothetical protein